MGPYLDIKHINVGPTLIISAAAKFLIFCCCSSPMSGLPATPGARQAPDWWRNNRLQILPAAVVRCDSAVRKTSAVCCWQRSIFCLEESLNQRMPSEDVIVAAGMIHQLNTWLRFNVANAFIDLC